MYNDNNSISNNIDSTAITDANPNLAIQTQANNITYTEPSLERLFGYDEELFHPDQFQLPLSCTYSSSEDEVRKSHSVDDDQQTMEQTQHSINKKQKLN
jgi:hypothetical protein